MRIVLLEHPRAPSAFHFNDIANTPLWSCLMTGYAAAALREAGFEVTLIDAVRRSFAETVDCLMDTPAELLAVHAVYFWERTAELFAMLAEVKRRGWGGTICLFGFFPTLAWRELLEQAPPVDAVVVGEPEETLVEFARSLETGGIGRIEGLAARSFGQPALGGRRPPIRPLDRLPFPLRPDLEAEETVSVLASRGCYNGCSFCLVPALDDGLAAWRGRSAENVAAECAWLAERGKKDLYFVDPNFVGPGRTGQAQALRLGRALAGLGLTFGMETRANDVTAPLMARLREAGLKSLLLGIESGSPAVLKRLRKHTTVAQNERALAAVRDAGIEPDIGFIMFEPGSRLEDVHANTTFLERAGLLDRLGRTANLLYHSHIAFKGTPGYRAAAERGRLVPEGLYGFEGRLLYEDPRVGWLAGIMRPICQFVLREMGRPGSRLHWSAENAEGTAYRAVNDQLVEIYRRLLAAAGKMTGAPDAAGTARRLSDALQALAQTLAQAGAGAG
jgi:radical SAM superfamily enzyme YgiQ (UPF0313 family)